MVRKGKWRGRFRCVVGLYTQLPAYLGSAPHWKARAEGAASRATTRRTSRRAPTGLGLLLLPLLGYRVMVPVLLGRVWAERVSAVQEGFRAVRAHVPAAASTHMASAWLAGRGRASTVSEPVIILATDWMRPPLPARFDRFQVQTGPRR